MDGQSTGGCRAVYVEVVREVVHSWLLRRRRIIESSNRRIATCSPSAGDTGDTAAGPEEEGRGTDEEERASPVPSTRVGRACSLVPVTS